MASPAGSRNFAEYRTVSEAAAFLGVSTATLRNWDRSGKLKPRRHPHNGYRIYLHDDLEAVLKRADQTMMSEAFAPAVDWSCMGDSEHFVQFYEDEDFLMNSVSGFISSTLAERGGGLVVAAEHHLQALQIKLSAEGHNLSEAIADGRLVLLDAIETLSKFMVQGMPDPQLFQKVVGKVVGKLAKRCQRIHAFGEMVALLWEEGNRLAAIRLEELWNELGKKYRFALFCAYPITGFAGAEDATIFDGICGCHSRVIPSESYTEVGSTADRTIAIAALQRKAESLSAEIAHRNQLQQSLEQRERELADFVENASEGLHKVAADGTILWANKAECDLLGYSKEEYVGRSIAEFHADADTIAEILRLLHAAETLENFPARMRCKDGSMRHVLINSSVCFENGKFAYTRCFTRDVTERWKAENALRDADRRKDEFLAMLAHELRNPLAPIKNSLAILRHSSDSEQARNIIERQVLQLTRLVDDLLDISRITRDKIELRLESVDLATIIKTAIETSRPAIDAGEHQLTVALPPESILVNADSTRLAQVFSNLLNNSAKYTESGGRIEVCVERLEHEARISVKDTGVGIDCEALAYVFNMFWQVDRSLERAQGGLGIGLTLVRRLVELHNGTVNAFSKGHGKGSEFVVHLPLLALARGTLDRDANQNRTASCPRRVLVVDDNRDSGQTLMTLLTLHGHDVRAAEDGQQAIEIAEQYQPEFILMDIGMPNLNGYEATRRIRQSPWGKHIYIVAVTGWGQPSDLQQATEAGCSAHLVKPVDFVALGQLLATQPSLAP